MGFIPMTATYLNSTIRGSNCPSIPTSEIAFSIPARPGRRRKLTPKRRRAKKASESPVSKTSPGEFFRQVRNEAGKVVWPTRKETITTAIMVLIMTLLLAIFFLGVDSALGAIVKFLIGLIG
jgi:preprotein translocase subunit SecE